MPRGGALALGVIVAGLLVSFDLQVADKQVQLALFSTMDSGSIQLSRHFSHPSSNASSCVSRM